jgi:hypothetical protein
MRFESATYQNEHLPPGGTLVDAIVTVTASTEPADRHGAPGATAVVLVLDVSGSMDTRTKRHALRRAAAAAIAQLQDDVAFAVVCGNDGARVAYPRHSGLAIASAQTRREATSVVKRLDAAGGTAIGRWLVLARDLLEPARNAVRRVILLTDGADSDETPDELEAAVQSCVGVFQCDCRGVGVDWRVDELRRIATALLGTVDIVAEPDGMAADFDALVRGAMAMRVADVKLRLWLPRDAQLRFAKQVAPTIEELVAVAVDARTVELDTGAWRDEVRDFHIAITVPPQEVGDEMLAGRIGLVVGGEVVASSIVRATWTADAATSALIDPRVAHYTGQAELASAIADGLRARAAGDTDTATVRLARATKLATAAGNDDTLRLLARVVDIDDAPSGTVRLRRDVDRADEMALDARSTRTVRLPS